MADLTFEEEWARLNEQGVYLVEYAGVPDALIRLSTLVELASDEQRVADFVRRIILAVSAGVAGSEKVQ